MGYKLYQGGTRFAKEYYVTPIVIYNDIDPNKTKFSLGIETVNPFTGKFFKVQTDWLTLANLHPVDDFVTNY